MKSLIITYKALMEEHIPRWGIVSIDEGIKRFAASLLKIEQDSIQQGFAGSLTLNVAVNEDPIDNAYLFSTNGGNPWNNAAHNPLPINSSQRIGLAPFIR